MEITPSNCGERVLRSASPSARAAGAAPPTEPSPSVDPGPRRAETCEPEPRGDQGLTPDAGATVRTGAARSLGAAGAERGLPRLEML